MIVRMVLNRKTVRGSIEGMRQDLAERLAFAAAGSVASTYTLEPLENTEGHQATVTPGGTMFKRVLPLFLILLIGGCYHAQISTGAPASPQVIEQPWAHSFIGGLVPPNPIDASAQCTSGVSRVETRLSFVNMVASMFTFSIYSPMHLTVVCAASQDQARLMPALVSEDEPKLGPRLDRVPELEGDPAIHH